MAIKVLSLAENGYRRLANAITVTILMHTTFSPFDRRAIFVVFFSSFLNHCNEPSHFRLFYQQLFRPLQQTEAFEVTFPRVSVLRACIA